MIRATGGGRAWLVVVGLACMPAGFLAPRDPVTQYREQAYARPGRAFVLGADQYGRDIFSRAIVGARTSAQVALMAVSMGLAAALVVGGSAAWYRGWVDAALRPLTELFIAVPWWYLVLGIRACLPLVVTPAASALWMAASFALASWAKPAQVVRAIVGAAAASDHVVAARAAGASDARIVWRHLAPSAATTLATSAGVLIPRCVFAEVTMSFLGLGVPEPTPSWGGVLAGAAKPSVVATHPWMLLPAAAIGSTLAVMALACMRAGRSDR